MSRMDTATSRSPSPTPTNRPHSSASVSDVFIPDRDDVEDEMTDQDQQQQYTPSHSSMNAKGGKENTATNGANDDDEDDGEDDFAKVEESDEEEQTYDEDAADDDDNQEEDQQQQRDQQKSAIHNSHIATPVIPPAHPALASSMPTSAASASSSASSIAGASTAATAVPSSSSSNTLATAASASSASASSTSTDSATAATSSKQDKMYKTAIKRLMSDLKQMENDPPEGVSGAPTDVAAPFVWRCAVFGPSDTEWEGGVFQLQMQFGAEYPQKAPHVKFITRMFHPNVFADGSLCLDIIADKWSPIYTVSTILTSIQSLLADPNPASPANGDAAKLYASDKKEYRKRVRACVERSTEQ